MAMLPPEIAMTWYVPASCRRRSTSLVESGPIADEDGRHDGRRPLAPHAHARRDCPAYGRSARREDFGGDAAACDNLDEASALDGSHERRAVPRELPFAIRYTGIEISGGSSKTGRKCHAAAAAPLENFGVRDLAANTDQRSAGGLERRSVQFDAIDEHIQRDACRSSGRVRPQPAVNDREDLVPARVEVLIEECAQRWLARRRICTASERHASSEEPARQQRNGCNVAARDERADGRHPQRDGQGNMKAD